VRDRMLNRTPAFADRALPQRQLIAENIMP
jgi:hypothetical protein